MLKTKYLELLLEKEAVKEGLPESLVMATLHLVAYNTDMDNRRSVRKLTPLQLKIDDILLRQCGDDEARLKTSNRHLPKTTPSKTL